MNEIATNLHQVNNLKTAQILAIFTEGEVAQFSLWLQSPWANTNKKLLPLYEMMKRLAQKPTTKQQIFQKLYPSRAYDDKMMRNLLAALTRQAERFLAHQRLQADADLSKQLLAKAYLERHEPAWHEKATRELIAELAAKPVKATEDYLRLAQLHEELYHRPALVQAPQQLGHLQAASDSLDSFFSIVKWRHLIEMNERHLMLQDSNQLSINIELLENMSDGLNIPLLNILQYRFANPQTKTVEAYDAMKQQIFDNYGHISVQDKRLLLFYLINSAIRLWLNGHAQVLSEVLELYKTGLNEGLLTEYGRLTDKTYANIVTTGNSLRQFDFVADFIEKHTVLLAPDMREDGRIWATAHLHCKQENYEKCIDSLSIHKLNAQHFALLSKFLLMEAYFEAYRKDASYFSFMADFTEAFRKYVKREKSLSAARKTAILNFIKYTFLIVKNMEGKIPLSKWLNALKKTVNEEKQIQGKQWIIEKMTEIESLRR